MNITRTHDYINKTQNKPSEKTSKEHTRGMNLKEAKRANSGTPGILHSFPLISSFLPSSLLRSSFPLFSFFVLSFDLLFDLFHFANGFLATGKILRIILLLFVAQFFSLLFGAVFIRLCLFFSAQWFYSCHFVMTGQESAVDWMPFLWTSVSDFLLSEHCCNCLQSYCCSSIWDDCGYSSHMDTCYVSFACIGRDCWEEQQG